jgi:long-chain acyl-CoA synthetase
MLNELLSGPPPRGHRLRVARLGGMESMDLADLDERARRLAVALTLSGVRAGDRIGILAANSLQWVLLDLAALHIGAVTAGLQPGKFTAGPELCAEYGLTMLFTDEPAGGDRVRAIADVDRLIDALPPGSAPAPLRWAPDAVSTLKFTSGSTGKPKVIGATVGSTDASVEAVQQLFAHTDGDDILVFLPLSLLQQRFWIYSALRYGHDVTVTTYEAVFSAMPAARPTVVMGVPAFFAAAHTYAVAQSAAGGDPGAALRELFGGRIRYLWTGSAPAARHTLDFFAGAGLPLFEGYGLNETCIVAKNHPGANRPGSVGRVLPGKRVEIDADGVVLVYSDHPVNVTYEVAPPGASEKIFGPGGVVRTGDLGRLDEDGYLHILGRADDVIVLGNGRKVIVRPIEERLRESPAVEECVVLCPDDARLIALVSVPGAPADTAALARHLGHCNARAETDERVSRIVLVPERFTIENGLLTSQFKPRRAAIRDRYAALIADERTGIRAH